MLTQAIENLLNRNLPRSPRALELCTALTGKRVRIEAHGLGWVLIAECLVSSIRLSKGEAGALADAEISGSLMSLAALAGAHPEEVIRRGEVTIRGDAELAQKLRELAMLLRPDVKKNSRADRRHPRAPGAAAGAGRRGLWPAEAATTGVRNVAEYLAHERRDLVPGAEAEDFYRNVERLREDLDRLEARTHLLATRTSDDGAASDTDSKDS